ncbi:rhodanese-like domain-containing protein [Amorphus orientalis]|uniref:Rhodanese-related sulfurtransferase n=1 Tax=Amorphus orientalis TaxID=649198 RepID=A0AAE3VST8_9HYPH|nr:rhodanese-like domain-containing protein [Amorphus orientalis]MDQ0316956.1 rhodanese-related sulfurtransferase [Amorphus orientalis]
MSKTESIAGATLEVLTPQEVKEKFDRNEVVVIDVRTPAEFAFEHIKGAMLFPLSSFDASKLPGQSEKAIVFHCGSGVRSKRVAEACAAAGITQLAHMEGGFGAWKSAGLPYLATDPATGSTVSKP